MVRVKVLSVSVENGEMLVSAATSNTAYPDVVLTFSIIEGASQTIDGVKATVEGAAIMLWAGYGKPEWEVAE